VLLGAYTAFNAINLCILSIAGFLGKADDVVLKSAVKKYRRILVLIPAYKEDKVIIESVKANLQQEYPADLYDLAVIADSCQEDTISQLKSLPIKVIEVEFESSTVSRALNAGLASIADDDYSVVVISDADNHMAPDFLARINRAFDEGWRAVQGHRVAKNVNTRVAVLDAISEEVNNHIFRKGHRALGFSSSLIGSGMAFEFNLLKKHLSQIDSIGGYDKELEMRLMSDKLQIAYLEGAYIFDEKVQTPFTFEQQRTRWAEAQIQQAQLHLRQVIPQLLKGNFDYVERTAQMLMLPRVLLLGVLVISVIMSLIFGWTRLLELFGSQLILVSIALAVALPGYLRKRLKLNVLLMVPVLFFRFVRSVFNFRRAQTVFIHTPHSTDDNVLI
jgi:cellulose synthase/poly-beta-1,6-N-acetylglucosamine synthase-like glycosyltransferase